ncbi:PREDICTED: uncharacterized protein LOC109355924 [Lupinus angustifolius]|uniref:uncharacterized protein LOC109355924 n=1 Tax=Lupinus angustifolius TaxID=3871 RepID=UPI00092F3327|nr:PREDICTED: uncharacterized protein LOC109355924 [Lupinus angustifolius]XP_019454757.1 PREDICTED: uncharacterized protein LOC109355924 [Lupinus angustifolius]
MYTERVDHRIKDKHGKICSEAIYDLDSSNYSDSKLDLIDGSGSTIGSERQVNIMNGGESGKNNYSDTHINGTKSISASTRRSSSSSSSESSSDGFFGMDTLKFTTSGASTSKSEQNYVSNSQSSSKSEVDNIPPVSISTFQVCNNVIHNQKDMPPTVSPPIQVMDRSGGFDPARIPSAVFDINTNPLEWSLASNESLFSLHVGDNSFSRDHVFGEVCMSPEFTKSGETNLFTRTQSVIIEEIDTARNSVNVENPQTVETSDEPFKVEEERLSEDQNEIKNSDQTASSKSSKVNVSSLYHESENSSRSFAFPIKKRPRSLCYCSNCSWAFCYKWPTCCHTRPSCKCSSCGWACCYSWNFSYTKSHGHASPPILAETKRNSSAKIDVPQPQSYKQDSQTTSNSTDSSSSCLQVKEASKVSSKSSCNWFHCFSCSSCTCKPCCSGFKCFC